MENETLDRRSFLGVSAMGAAAIASGVMFGASALENKMAPVKKIFVCSVCGHVEFGSLPDLCPVCRSPKEKFGSDDALFSDVLAKSPEMAAEHVPEVMVDKPSKSVKIRVGKTLHPMTDEHHIQWIDCYVDDRHVSRLSMVPGSTPAMGFYPGMNAVKVKVVQHCNLHGHWQAEAAL